MKSRKQQIRAALEVEMAMFLSQGNVVHKFEPKGRKQNRKEITVEVDTDYLPQALKQKYFKV